MTYNELINGAKANGYSIENDGTIIKNDNFKFIIHDDNKGIYRIDVYAYLDNKWYLVKNVYDSKTINTISEVLAK